MAGKRSPAVRARRLKRGTPVMWHYRSAIGHGYVDGVASEGDTDATTRYKVRQVDNHVSDSGSHEKPVVIHTGAALTKTTSAAVQAAAERPRRDRER